MVTIVQQTNDFIAVDKPCGMLTVPSRMGEADPRPCLGITLQKDFGPIYPVHRLDYEVSGIVLFARNAEAHRILNSAFEDRDVLKTYEAISEGLTSVSWLPGHTETWHSKIQRGKRRSFFAAYGQEAETEAIWNGMTNINGNGFLSWTLKPLTGRPHQLRLELSSRSFPIWGDELYGSKTILKPNAIALRAVTLIFGEKTRQALPGLPAKFEVKPLADFLRDLT